MLYLTNINNFMRILLIGEYSHLHNSLKEGLIKLGHTVQIVGLNDGFKNYSIDIKVERKFSCKFFEIFHKISYKLFALDILSYHVYKKFCKLKHNTKNYDVVQLINENSFLINPFYEKKIIEHLTKNNQNYFYLVVVLITDKLNIIKII